MAGSRHRDAHGFPVPPFYRYHVRRPGGVGKHLLAAVGLTARPPALAGRLGEVATTLGAVLLSFVAVRKDRDYVHVQTREVYQRASTPLPTMASCDPSPSARMRIVAYAEFESREPSDAGPPAPIAKQSAGSPGPGGPRRRAPGHRPFPPPQEPPCVHVAFRQAARRSWCVLLISTLLVVLVILVLMEYVFPWASQFSPWAESTIGLVQ